jgi:peptide alpha-N-acetyltransferase
MAISEMVSGECEEVVLEAEVSNTGALALYRSLGFIRDKHLHRCGAEQCDRLGMCLVCMMSRCTARSETLLVVLS